MVDRLTVARAGFSKGIRETVELTCSDTARDSGRRQVRGCGVAARGSGGAEEVAAGDPGFILGSMKTFPSRFLNVDLDFKSRADPAALVKAWDGRMLASKVHQAGGRHWFRFMLTFQPKSPAQPFAASRS